MNALPLPICRIVYRYLYDAVLTQLISSYGKTLRLQSVTAMCKRIRNDTTWDTMNDNRWWQYLTSRYSYPSYTPHNAYETSGRASWEFSLLNINGYMYMAN